MNIAVVTVPYITTKMHVDMMYKSIATMTSDEHELKFYAVPTVIGSGYMKDLCILFDYIHPAGENCLATAWNKGIMMAVANPNFRPDLILLPNLDIFLEDKSIDNLVAFTANNRDTYVFSAFCTNSPIKQPDEYDYEVNHVTMWDNYACFMIRPVGLSILAERDHELEPYKGWFDENFKPAYYEDVDFQYRLQRAGMKHLCTRSAKFEHHRNITIRGHENPLEALHSLGSEMTTGYMVKKWNGARSDDMYKNPFNGS